MSRPGKGGSAVRLADVVRDHRRRVGLTQQELAAKAGLSLAALRDLEQGRRSRPRSASLAGLAKALGLDPGQAAELASLAGKAQRRSPEPDPPEAGTWNGAEPAGARQGLWLAVLGPLEARLDGTPVPLGPPGRRAVLGLLAMDPGTVVRRDSVIDMLWGPQAPSTGGSLVQAHVSRLRKLLAPRRKEPWAEDEIIASVGGGYRLQLRTEQLDVLAFRALAAKAGAALATGDDLAACELYEQTMELWRGDPLADVDVLHDLPGVVEQRRQLADVLLRYAELACGLGFHDRVLPRLHALAAAEPLNERVHAHLMIALAGTGQQAAALGVYEDLRARLDREFAIYPSEELVHAHLRVLHQDLPVVRPAYGQLPGHVVPGQLPASARFFTGRSGDSAMLSHLLGRGPREAGGVLIAALTGMAGIGKTALAVSWAHQVAGQFPDGQLFADLQGFSHSDPPLAPAEALRGFLTALGVAPTRIPADTAGRAALYRSMLVGRRALIVADNARDAEQVRPLLPGSPGCLVLVTSRHRLTGLAAENGAFLLPMAGLSDGEAYSLLAKILGAERMMTESAAIGELSALCARLPLALCNAAARAAARPRLPLATLVAEMRDERGRLNALETGEPATSLRGVFSLSQARLSAPAARMFQMLGIHPGPEITVPGAAALAGLKRARARAALAELCDGHLLTEHAPGRYTCHELLRAYAAEAAARTRIREDGWRACVYRMLDYYLHTASAASILLFPYLAPRMLEPPRPGVLPERFATVRQATRWARSEARVLLAVIDQAAEGGYGPHAWELPWAAGWLFRDEAGWRKLAAAQEAALVIADGLGDLAGAALAHHHLAWLSFWLGDDAGASRHLGESIDIANRLSEVFPTPLGLGVQTVRVRGDIPEALVHAGRALSLFRPGGDAFSAISLAAANRTAGPRDCS